MPTTADIRNGLCFKLNGELYQVIEFLHVKPGKGPAFVRTKIRNINNGKVIDKTFNSGIKIDVVRIENRSFQYLYSEEDMFTFMDIETYDQISIEKHIINAPQFLKESDMVDILFYMDEERPISCELRQFVQLEITYTEPGIKGDTATNATKPATVETGAEIKVPLFINLGDVVKIDTKKGEYCERVKQ